MGWYLGLDVGSFRCKAALMEDERLAGTLVAPAGTDYGRSGRDALVRLLAVNRVGEDEVCGIAATGVGGARLGLADSLVGDVVCTARGAFAVAPSVRTVIDVGAQSSRVIWLDDRGRVAHFASNEKCATGSGRFLQVIANVLRVKLEEVGPLSLGCANPVAFSTGCAVFGESEAITRVSEGVPKEAILAGVHRSLAEKIASLVRTRGLRGPCAVCGGGALDAGLVRRLEETLGTELFVPDAPQVVGAVGAAVQARRTGRDARGVRTSLGRRGSPASRPRTPRRVRPVPGMPGHRPVIGAREAEEEARNNPQGEE